MTEEILKIVPDWNIPLYMQIFERVRDMIRNGELKPGEKLPVSRLLQKRLKLSSFTVEKGIRLLVESGWVVRRPRIGTFVAESLPSTLPFFGARTEKGVVCVVFNRIFPYGEYWFSLLLHLEKALCRAGFRMELRQMDDEIRFSAAELSAGYSGVIFCGTCPTVLVRQLSQTKVPLVLLGALDQPNAVLPEVDMLVHDDKANAFEGMKHLLDLGHRNIGCIVAPEGTQLYKNYIAGIRKAAKTYGLDSSMLRIVSLPAASVPDGDRAVRPLLCENTDITAIFSSDAMLACGVRNGVARLGLRIPDDISLISLGNDPVLDFMHPAVTAVSSSADMADFTGAAVKMLVNQKKKPESARRIVCVGKPCIFLRESTRFFRHGNIENKQMKG